MIGMVWWEASRQRRQSRQGFVSPVSTEGIRWAQYAGASYVLGYAGLAFAVLDPHGADTAVWLRMVVFCTCLATGLMLWNLGLKYGNTAPRLNDMRFQCYAAEVRLWQRAQLLTWQLNHRTGDRTLLAAELAAMQELLERCEVQLQHLQHALSTSEFVSRLRDPEASRDHLARLHAEQAALLRLAAHFLEPVETRTPALVPVYQRVR